MLVLGEVRCFRQGALGPTSTVELARITDESEVTYFGELALYLRRPRSACVQALDRCFLLELEAANFDDFTAVVPDFRKRVKALKAVSAARHRVVGRVEDDGGALPPPPPPPPAAGAEGAEGAEGGLSLIHI